MEERIVDDEIGRGIRLKKTKDGYVDVTDVLAPDTDEKMEEVEELTVVLPELDGEASEDAEEEAAFAMPVMHAETDDEDLVDLSPEEAERVRREKADRLARRKEAYKNACAEGEQLLAMGSYRAAELVYEKALQFDEMATEASVGYWRAKTADFTDPDVLIEDYLEDGIEELESDLGFIAADIIKKNYRAAFEKRLQELSEQEAPLVKSVEEKQAARRQILSKRRIVTGVIFLGALLPFIVVLIATGIVGMKNFSTSDNSFVVPTIVLGCMSLVAFIGSLIAFNQFFNACRMYNMNEDLSSTEEGREILDIRQYRDIYEDLLYVQPEEKEEETEETDGEE